VHSGHFLTNTIHIAGGTCFRYDTPLPSMFMGVFELSIGLDRITVYLIRFRAPSRRLW
jgi:hypothetical protein